MARHISATKKFSMYPRFIQIFLANQLQGVPVPVDNFPLTTLTNKALKFMAKPGKGFSGKVTPLFASMLVVPAENVEEEEDGASAKASEPIPTPHDDQPSLDSSPDHITNPKGFGGNGGSPTSSDSSHSGSEDVVTLPNLNNLCMSLVKQITD